MLLTLNLKQFFFYRSDKRSNKT